MAVTAMVAATVKVATVMAMTEPYCDCSASALEI
jgi:hypothetical protein